MYTTCAFHGCDITFNRCEIHHLHYYELGGTTDLDNLIPLCSRHHHVIHDLGWTLELDHHRTLTIRDADGNTHATIPLPASVRGITPNRADDADNASNPSAKHAAVSDDRPPERPPDRPPGQPPDQLTLIA